MTARQRHLFLDAFACAAVLVACACLPLAAQYEDDTLDDHAQQDQRYLERYKQQEQEPEPEVAPEDDSRAEAFIALAEELIRDKNYRSFTADRFRVQTDDPRVDPKAVALLLEGFHDYFDSFWSGTLELQPRESLSRVFLFYSFYKYNQLLDGDWRFSAVRPKGHYLSGVNAITLHTDSAAVSDLADVLIHEEAHQLFGERLFTAEYAIPTWVTEGLASYFGYTFMDDEGQFQAGAIGGKMVALMRGENASPGREGKQRLGSLKKSMKSKSAAPGLVEVTRIKEPAAFYSRPEWSYSSSWILVHYLLHGDDGARRQAFARYLVQASQGNSGTETLLQELGISAEELEAAATNHLKRLKAR